MSINKYKTKRGQSLIEAIVALGVLTMGFLGIVSVLSKSFFYEKNISNTMTATYLASEGIEVIKNIIDNASSTNGTWYACLQNGASYEVDHQTNCNSPISSYYSGNYLRFDNSTNLYSYDSSASPTIFLRDIKIDISGDELTVNSIVSWSNGVFSNQSIDMEDHFYNWKPKS